MGAAVEFSFLLGPITLAAAAAYEGLRSGDQLVANIGVATPLLGLVVASSPQRSPSGGWPLGSSPEGWFIRRPDSGPRILKPG